MPAARTGDDHVRPAREEIDLKLLVRGDGVKTDLGGNDRRVGQGGNVVSQEVADGRFVVIFDATILDIGIDIRGRRAARPSHPGPESPACRKTNRPRPLP